VTPADLHAAIIAAIRQRRALAEAAETAVGVARNWRRMFAGVGNLDPGAVASLGAANDPAFTVRMCRAALERMERHAPRRADVWAVGQPEPPALCRHCGEEAPCDVVRAEAGVWDVEVDGDG
jgi:hypothetical protein